MSESLLEPNDESGTEGKSSDNDGSLPLNYIALIIFAAPQSR